METITTSIRLDAALLSAYDELAKTTGRSRNYVLTEALRQYLLVEREHQERLDLSIEQANREEFADDAEQVAWKDDLFAHAGISPSDREAEEQRVDQELRRAYGLPSCE